MVEKALAWLWLDRRKKASTSTAAYCQARRRLPEPWLRDLCRSITEAAQASCRAEHRWHGRHVRVVDGSAVSMPDTPDNQRAYPQSPRQKPGCGFPVARLLAVFSLATGAVLDFAWNALTVSERSMLHALWDRFPRGDVVLADRGFCGYADFWWLRQRGVDCVMRNHQRRTKGVRLVKQLAANDRLVQWIKTKIWIRWLDRSTWEAIPETMTVRETRLVVDIPGFRTKNITVVTTLLDEKEYPARDLTDLYRRRWLAELFLRDLKITMGLDVLRCKTAAMVDKEIIMHLIAYNLIRALLYQAAIRHRRDPFGLSFKAACQTVIVWQAVVRHACTPGEIAESLEMVLHYLARNLIPLRPDRVEPRAIKRRRKNYQLLNQPRGKIRIIGHRNKYKKNLS